MQESAKITIMANEKLSQAKKAKNDEFYTQWADIEREVLAYLDFDPDVFKGKTILCPCDDPYESNFFKYFAIKFNEFKIKKLIATCYAGSPIANVQLSLFPEENEENKTTRQPHKIVITKVPDINKDGSVDLEDVELLLASDRNHLTRLKGDGDFRSEEITKLRDEADIIITNPPFSLFREFLAWIVEADKKFLIIGNMNAITYKEVFPLIKENKIWLGESIHSGDREFAVPDTYPLYAAGYRIDEQGKKYIRVKGVRWFTNLDHGRRHQPLPLMTMAKNIKFSRHKEIKGKKVYDRYDNYDAIEVPFTDAIPSDYDGVMGVPISFMDKYCPEQFEILGIMDRQGSSGLRTKKYTSEDTPKYNDLNARGVIRMNGELTAIYARILIKHKGAVK